MRKFLFLSSLALMISVMTYLPYKFNKDEGLSELKLANIEALTNDESGGGNTPCWLIHIDITSVFEPAIRAVICNPCGYIEYVKHIEDLRNC